MTLKPYENLNGHSGVIGYRIYDDSIIVEFHSGQIYVYSYTSAGSLNVERMKQLAVKGRGLSTFISTRVKMNYEKKL